MSVKINETLSIKLARRQTILKEIFVGCDIDTVGEDITLGNSIMRVRSPLSKTKKMIAYIESSSAYERPRDEFHILYKGLEPLVVVAIERFQSTGVERLERHMAPIEAMAHYTVDRNTSYDDLKLDQEDFSGRIDACVKVLRTIEEEQGGM